MNELTPEEVILDSIRTGLVAAYPARAVTRSLKDFADRKKVELENGVYTILANGLPNGEVYFQTMKLLIVGQFKLREKSEGEEVEKAELVMIREIRNFIQRKLRGPDLRILQVEQSAQLEVPYGWVSAQIEAGPYDATEPLTVDENLGNLADFLTFRADIDIAPHESAAEHNKWAKDTPDYSTSQPDAQLQVDIPRSTP